MSKDPPVYAATSGAGVAACLDDMAAKLGRKVRVYVIGYKDRSKEETTRLIKSADISVMFDAWEALDDRSRYEWVNK
jgi:hypothetical protein